MNLAAGKRDATKLATLLEELAELVPCETCKGVNARDCETCEGAGGFARSSEEAAKALLVRAWEIYEEKSKWMVLGALVQDPNGKTNSITAERVAFGPYGTETQARAASAQLFYSKATEEEFVRWLVPMTHGTPAQWFLARKREREEAVLAEGEAGYTKSVPPHHQGTPERQAAAQAAVDARQARINEAWERALRLRDHQEELDPEVPRSERSAA